MSNGLHNQKLLEYEVNGLLILAHALGVSRPCILEVRAKSFRLKNYKRLVMIINQPPPSTPEPLLSIPEPLPFTPLPRPHLLREAKHPCQLHNSNWHPYPCTMTTSIIPNLV